MTAVEPRAIGRVVDAGNGVSIHVRTVGSGRPVLMIPSLGRGVDDFNTIARLLAAQGYMSIMPEPRGIGGSSGPAPTDLFDLAQDNASVLAELCHGPVDVVGHAFGNRVARALATPDPGRIGRLALLAGGGKTAMSSTLRAALIGSVSQGLKPDAQRLTDLKTAFFFRDNDPAIWLEGWYPAIAELQMAATERTNTARWWTAGRAPVLLVQAEADPIAPAGNASALGAEIGDRLTLVKLRNASHAILPEQPEAVAALLANYFSGDTDRESLQQLTDSLIA